MKTVAVLEGGWSNEREVSLMGTAEVSRALDKKGYIVRRIPVTRDIFKLVNALTPRPDVVYNGLHGPYGEDGCIQGVLEYMRIPYSHSGILASALAMNKPMAKNIFLNAGIPCPPHQTFEKNDFRTHSRMEPPYVLKPINEGSSFGISIVHNSRDPLHTGQKAWTFSDIVMVEKYIEGREITVSVMGNRALGVTEIRTYNNFYDYDAKYTVGRAEHLLPAPIHPEAYEKAMSYAVQAHKVLGCRGISRADFIYEDKAGEPGKLYLLEVNTQPGMTPLSLLPEQAAHAGIGFEELVSWIVEEALCDG